MFARRALASMLLMALVFASCEKAEEPSEPVKEEPAEEQKEEEKKEEEQEERKEEEKEPEKETPNEFVFPVHDLSPEILSQKGYKYLSEITDTNYYYTVEDFYARVSGSVLSDMENLGLGQETFNNIVNLLYADDIYSLAARRLADTGNEAEGRYEEYIFKYNTTSAAGEPIVLSGVVVLPNSQTDGEYRYTLDNLTLINDYYKEKTDYISKDGALQYIRAIYNQAVVASDYEGYGVTADRIHPYVSYNELARQSIDCELAALELLDYIGVDLNKGYRTYNMGMSKGAGTTLAVHRLLENSEPDDVRDKFNLAGSYCATGLYDMKGMLEYYNDRNIDGEATDEENFQIAWISSIAIYLAYHTHQSVFESVEGFEGLKSFFREDFYKKSQDAGLFTDPSIGWDGTEAFFRESGYGTLNSYLNPRFFVDKENSEGEFDETDPLVAALFSVFDEENPTSGWSPRTPILMEHSRDDQLSVYELSVKNYQELKYNGIIPNFLVNFNSYSGFVHHTMSAITVVRMTLLEIPYEPVIYNVLF